MGCAAERDNVADLHLGRGDEDAVDQQLDPIAGHCRPRRHRLTATVYRQHRNDASATWREVTGVAVAA